MRDKWQQLLEKFAALNTRERMLILLAVFAMAYQFTDLVILDRQFHEVQRLNSAMAKDNAAIVRLNTELNTLSRRVEDDPNKKLRARIQAARDEVAVLQTRLKDVTGELISPQDMARFLEQLLVQDGQLTMLRLETLDVKPLLNGSTGTNRTVSQPMALHRHGFAIEFSGSYLATLSYLEALEKLPWRFFWDSVSYEVLDYPKSIVRLELHTLSLSEDWIGV